MFEKFQEVKIEDKKLLEEIEELSNKRDKLLDSIGALTTELLVARENINRWFKKVREKYKIPERYRYKIYFDHKTQTIKLK